MAQGRLRKAVEKSINEAVNCGNIDLNKHAAPIAMLRYMADSLDSDTGETPMLRYVSPASFLNYCDALGLTPSSKSDEKKATKDKPSGRVTMTSMVGNSKWAKGRAADA